MSSSGSFAAANFITQSHEQKWCVARRPGHCSVRVKNPVAGRTATVRMCASQSAQSQWKIRSMLTLVLSSGWSAFLPFG
jgi:hypothetical protein